jgi:hypothetical protein
VSNLFLFWWFSPSRAVKVRVGNINQRRFVAVRFLFLVQTMMIPKAWTHRCPLVLKIGLKEKGTGLAQEKM